MNTRSSITTLILVGAVIVVGSTVDQSSFTTFEAGTPALADEMNANFQALIDAVNDNAARIENLEKGETASSPEELIAGCSFRFMAAPVTLGGGNFATSGEWVSLNKLSDIYTFKEDGTFTGESLVVSYEPRQNPVEGAPGPTMERVEIPTTEEGLWEVVGNTFRMTFAAGGVFEGFMSADSATLFVLFDEPLDPEPGTTTEVLAPEDAHIFGIGVGFKVSRAPVVASVNLVETNATSTTVTVTLSDEGCGGPLQFAVSTGGETAPDADWQDNDAFVLPTGDLQAGRFFWARRAAVPSEAAVLFELP